MTQAALQGNDTAGTPVLYMALELSKAKWKVGFEHNGRRRRVSVDGGNVAELAEAIATAKAKFKLADGVAVRSCYEAGREGFFLHRLLVTWGVANLVVDPGSIEVARRARRAKTDALDLEALLAKLIAHHRGEPVCIVVAP